MTIDVSAILKEIGGRIDIDGDVMLPDTDFLGETYHFNKPLRIKGHISSNGKSLILKALCEGSMTTRCARCMKEITVPVRFETDENLVRDEGGEADGITPRGDAVVFGGTEIDIDDIAANSFLMNIEGKYLCKEDCKGLCPECGKDLNEGECGCEKNSVDPRWSALLDIMNKDNK